MRWLSWPASLGRVDLVLKRRRTASLYKRVFGTAEGQIVLTDLCEAAQLGSHGIADTDRDTYAYLGARRIVLRILSLIGASEAEIVRELSSIRSGNLSGETDA